MLEAERQRSQVINVLDRQAATRAQWESALESADKQAELSGAENPVRLERKRCDEMVTEYARVASGLGGRVILRGVVVVLGPSQVTRDRRMPFAHVAPVEGGLSAR